MSYIGNTNTTQGFIPAIDYFSGNGSTTAFTLSRPVASVAQVQVTIDNVAQNPSSAYTVSANTITFTSAPLSGTNNIYVYYTSPITQVIAPGQGTVGATQIDTAYSLWNKSGSDITYTAGNVGIGGTPVKTLSILPTSIRRMDFYVRDPGVDDSLVIRSQHATNNNIRDMILEGSTVKVFTGADSGGSGSERARIDSSGNLLVGTTSTVAGERFNVTAGSTTGILVKNTGGADSAPIYYWNATTTGNGYFAAFFTETSASFRGSITYNRAAGLISYNTTSDYRAKTVNGLVQNALSKVVLLKPSTGRMNGATEDIDFFVAHELQQVVPSAVIGEKDAVNEDNTPKYQVVDKSALIPLLTAAIQELKAINDTQAETINALTARIEALEAK